MKKNFLLIGCVVLMAGCASNSPTQTPAPVADTTAIKTIPSVHQGNLPALPSDEPDADSLPEYSKIVHSKNMVSSRSPIRSSRIAPVVCKPVAKVKHTAHKARTTHKAAHHLKKAIAHHAVAKKVKSKGRKH